MVMVIITMMIGYNDNNNKNLNNNNDSKKKKTNIKIKNIHLKNVLKKKTQKMVVGLSSACNILPIPPSHMPPLAPTPRALQSWIQQGCLTLQADRGEGQHSACNKNSLH